MQKFLSLVLLSVISVPFVLGAGFVDNNAAKTTVINALKMNNNSYVTVEGHIVKRISDDKYTFKDSTGSMTVEIDNDKWNDLTVNTQDKLELSGEIEKKFISVILDVDKVEKVKLSK
jgi:uncharacterized protein (TIGR00156 family)